jgi:hypothetical protein
MFPVMYEGSNFSTSLLALVIAFFYFNLPNGREVISHCVDLPFSKDQSYQASFHIVWNTIQIIFNCIFIVEL